MKRSAFIAVICLFFFTGLFITSCGSNSSAAEEATSDCANCVSCATIEINVISMGGNNRQVTVNYSFPLGFLSITEETTKAVSADPWIILSDKLQTIEIERMWATGMQKIPVVFYTEGGCMKFQQTFSAVPDDFIQSLATTWDGLKYEWAIAEPGSVINRVYCLSGLIGLAQRPDDSWGFKVR